MKTNIIKFIIFSDLLNLEFLQRVVIPHQRQRKGRKKSTMVKEQKLF